MTTANSTSAASLLLLLLFFLPTPICLAQRPTDDRAFDFWLGDWDAYWNDSLKGSNQIRKILDGKVIEENFAYLDGSFHGRSWSVRSPRQGNWQQTWVDDSGAYLLLESTALGDSVILQMTDPVVKSGQQVHKRMVFFNIHPDRFDWDWQSSLNGKDWTSTWLIHYVRKPTR